jgi:hypothetical protein
VTGYFEGDLIRPLGLVTLYAAYAEGEVDQLLAVLPASEPFDDAKRQWPVGRKLEYAEMLVRKLKSETLAGLSASLREARELFLKRNELVHGKLFSGGRLVSNRVGVPEQRISPEELSTLAEKIFSCKEHLNVYRQRHLMPLLEERAAGKPNDA